jgi:hypothetical protein
MFGSLSVDAMRVNKVMKNKTGAADLTDALNRIATDLFDKSG